MTTTERLWIAYCASMAAVALLAADGGEVGVQRVPFVLLHAAVALLQCVPVLLRRRSERAARVARAAIAVVGLPAVFSSLCWVLPGLHSEPWHLVWYRLDLAILGRDMTMPLRASLTGAMAAALQVIYACFYLLPIAAVVLSGLERGSRAFDRALAAVVGGFLLSYLGYLWFPTLGPKDMMPSDLSHANLVAEWMRVQIDGAEANPWDCFPSGHTMMSLVGAFVVRRYAPRWFAPVLALALAIAFSTVALRYHWPVDVLAGAVLAFAWLGAIERLHAVDGTPAA